MRVCGFGIQDQTKIEVLGQIEKYERHSNVYIVCTKLERG